MHVHLWNLIAATSHRVIAKWTYAKHCQTKHAKNCKSSDALYQDLPWRFRITSSRRVSPGPFSRRLYEFLGVHSSKADWPARGHRADVHTLRRKAQGGNECAQCKGTEGPTLPARSASSWNRLMYCNEPSIITSEKIDGLVFHMLQPHFLHRVSLDNELFHTCAKQSNKKWRNKKWCKYAQQGSRLTLACHAPSSSASLEAWGKGTPPLLCTCGQSAGIHRSHRSFGQRSKRCSKPCAVRCRAHTCWTRWWMNLSI